MMKDGSISESGTYEELVRNDAAFADFLRTYIKDEELGEGKSFVKLTYSNLKIIF